MAPLMEEYLDLRGIPPRFRTVAQYERAAELEKFFWTAGFYDPEQIREELIRIRSS